MKHLWIVVASLLPITCMSEEALMRAELLTRNARLEQTLADAIMRASNAEAAILGVREENELLRVQVRDLLRQLAAARKPQPDPFAASTGSDPFAPAAQPPQAEQWVAVFRQDGHGDMTTQKVTVGRDWRVVWSYGAIEARTYSYLSIHASGERSQRVVSISRPDKGVSYGQRAGTYQFEVSTANAAWSMVVEERR